MKRKQRKNKKKKPVKVETDDATWGEQQSEEMEEPFK
jgi:hypothetical protein